MTSSSRRVSIRHCKLELTNTKLASLKPKLKVLKNRFFKDIIQGLKITKRKIRRL